MSYRDKVKQRAMRKLAARHRETVMRVIDSAQTLARAAEYLKQEYYHAYYGWDSRQEWIACMMLLQEAHRLIGAEFWELSLTPAYIDPFVMLWWKGEEGRAARLRKEATEKCLSQAAVLAHSQSQPEAEAEAEFMPHDCQSAAA